MTIDKSSFVQSWMLAKLGKLLHLVATSSNRLQKDPCTEFLGGHKLYWTSAARVYPCVDLHPDDAQSTAVTSLQCMFSHTNVLCAQDASLWS